MSALKEPYFTPDNTAEKAQNMQLSIQEFIRKRAYTLIPERSALLLLDMQAYFFNESSHAFIPSAIAILPRVNALIRAFSNRNLPVFQTRHLNTLQNAGMMATWWSDLISVDNPLSIIDPRLEIYNGITINKTRYDAFVDSTLEELLDKSGVHQLVICGVMTHLCCETTARSAFMRGYEVFFTIDGTATYNEAFHRASLLNLSHGFAYPVLAQDILARINENESG
jgi:bifunctional isochorismate lyase/aryl carrier protein